MNHNILSKSRYCRGLQCPKILWLDAHKPELRDDSAISQSTLDTGKAVGAIARGYFGEYAEVPYSSGKNAMVSETRRLLEKGTPVICEASFLHDDNFCSVDILRRVDNGVEIVEVKSSTDVKPVYLDDLAYQCYVLTGCGYKVRKVSLLSLNKKYVRHGELDIQELFVLEDYTETILSMQPEIKKHIAGMNAVASAQAEPQTDIGIYCKKPYDCAYQNYCWRHINALPNSIFDINGNAMHWDKKFQHYYAGIVTLEDLISSGEKLSPKVALQVETEVKDLPPAINRAEIKNFLQCIRWPLYFLDFETMMPAIPLYDDSHPYQQIPFQYSLHIQTSPGGPLEHREFLAQEGDDPRRALAERLCADIPLDECVLAWNMSFEKTRIKELAGLFPDLQVHLMDIHENIRDLIIPFRQHHYYCRGFKGKSSIKLVLPALCPNAPELDYHSLDLIHHGGEAMEAFAALPQKSPAEREHIRAALLAYCRLDTLAMVKILEKLQQSTS
jgi:hypothetical protein